jgi:hypothetical protein
MPPVTALIRQKVLDMMADLIQVDIIFIPNAGAPTDGTTGTGAGRCGPCSLCFDYSNTDLYINTGTMASPVWILVGVQY